MKFSRNYSWEMCWNLSTSTLHWIYSGSRLLTSDTIHIIANYLHFNVLNMGYKNDLIHLKEDVLSLWYTTILWQSLLTWLTASDEIRVLLFDIHLTSWDMTLNITWAKLRNLCVSFGLLSICIEHGLESWLENGDEIIVLQLDMQLIFNQNRIRTWFRPTEVFRVLTVYIQPICSVYELDTRLALSNEIRIYAKVI